MDKRQRRLRSGKRRRRRTLSLSLSLSLSLCVSELTLFFTPVVKEKGGGRVRVGYRMGERRVGIIVLKCIALCEASIQSLGKVHAVQQELAQFCKRGQCSSSNNRSSSIRLSYKKERWTGYLRLATMWRKESPCTIAMYQLVIHSSSEGKVPGDVLMSNFLPHCLTTPVIY